MRNKRAVFAHFPRPSQPQVGVMETHDPAPLPASTVEYRRLAQEVEAAGAAPPWI